MGIMAGASLTATQVENAVWDALTANHVTASTVGLSQRQIRDAAISGSTADSLLDKIRGATTGQLFASTAGMALSNFTFTRTQATITATTLTNVLNKTTGGGMVYAYILAEDLDASAGVEDMAMNLDSEGLRSPTTGAVGAASFYPLLMLNLLDVNGSLNGSENGTPGSPMYFQTSLQLQWATHATPTSGTRVTIAYGDPPKIWGHKQGMINELWEHYMLIPVDMKLESAYLIAELRKHVDAEIDCIREDVQAGQRRLWFEHAQTQSPISATIKQKCEDYCKTTYVYKKDTRAKVKDAQGIVNYIAPVIV